MKTSREKLKELSWWSYDEKDTVFSVKRARAWEQQQLNIERIKAEIVAENKILDEKDWWNETGKSNLNHHPPLL